jgi:MoaA/NifB/PqqE/SkfB family radical SAM enzyme
MIERCLKTACTVASVLFYRDRRHADWLYEKMNRPATYAHQFLNVLHYITGKPSVYRIISLVIEPVFGCNLSCSYCWNSITRYFEHKSRRPRHMPLSLFKKAVDQAPSSVESVAFALIGEPLLHPDIHTMIAYARSRGLRTVLYTNGTLLTGNVRDRIAGSGLDVLVVSVEPDPANSLKHRGVKLETLQSKIHEFIRIKPVTMDVKLSVVVHQDNVESIKDLDIQYRGLVEHIKLSPMIRYNGTRSSGRCIEPWRGSLGILTSGDVTPCCVSAGYRPIIVGNIETDSLDTIAHGSGMTSFLRDLAKGLRPDICHRCRAYQRNDIPLRVPALSVKTRKTP